MNSIIRNIILIFFLLLNSCDNSTGVGSEENKNLIPLQINNQWHYNLIKYRYNPDDSLTSLFDSTSLIMEVTKYDTLGIYTGFQIINIPFWISLNADYPIFYYKADGFYFAELPYLVWDPPASPTEKRLLLYPTNIGDVNIFNDYSIITAERNEAVRLYNDIYYCIRYEVMYNDEIVGKIWVAPGIGIVKTWQIVGLMRNNYFLSSYNINKGNLTSGSRQSRQAGVNRRPLGY